jgi:hypothetical protein
MLVESGSECKAMALAPIETAKMPIIRLLHSSFEHNNGEVKSFIFS